MVAFCKVIILRCVLCKSTFGCVSVDIVGFGVYFVTGFVCGNNVFTVIRSVYVYTYSVFKLFVILFN